MDGASGFSSRSIEKWRPTANNKISKSSEKNKQKSDQCKQWEADVARLRSAFKYLHAENIKAEQMHNSSDMKNTAPAVGCTASILKKGTSSSSKKVHFSDKKSVHSPLRQSSNIVRNLFNNDKISTPSPLNRNLSGNKENISEFVVTDDPDAGVLNSSIMSVDDKHDSTFEYAKYEFLCENDKVVEPSSDKQDIFMELKEFIHAQNTQMYDKIAILIKEHTDTLFAKIMQVQGQYVAETGAKDEGPNQKRKVDDLRINVIKKAMVGTKSPDTPSTSKKMKVATDMYNSMRKDLNSPYQFASALAESPIGKQTPKSALSRIIQKQCLSLVE